MDDDGDKKNDDDNDGGGSREERASLSNTGVLVITEIISRNDNRSVFID